MLVVQDYVSQMQTAIAEHAFFKQLGPRANVAEALWFAPRAAFWAMSFQDVIRLNVELAKDPQMKRMLKKHWAEDRGHDKWYLEDLKQIGRGDIDLAWLYGPECRQTRDSTYALAGEVFQIHDDRLRLVLVLALEGAGHVFFERVTTNLVSSGFTTGLRYFDASHFAVEKAHDMFDHESQREIRAIELPPDIRQQAIAIVDRVFASFRAMADGLVSPR